MSNKIKEGDEVICNVRDSRGIVVECQGVVEQLLYASLGNHLGWHDFAVVSFNGKPMKATLVPVSELRLKERWEPVEGNIRIRHGNNRNRICYPLSNHGNVCLTCHDKDFVIERRVD